MSTNQVPPGDGIAPNTNTGNNPNAGAPAASSSTNNARFTPQQQHVPTPSATATANQSTSSPSTTTQNNQNLNQIVSGSADFIRVTLTNCQKLVYPPILLFNPSIHVTSHTTTSPHFLSSSLPIQMKYESGSRFSCYLQFLIDF